MADKDLQDSDKLMLDKDGEQARPWKLPFWTEEAVHDVKREKARTALALASRSDESVESEAEPEEEQELHFPTAEELENIRREAYNEGLEQGLVEGRQSGEKNGYDDGHAKGLEEGKAAGEKEGKTVGFNEGKAEALKETREQIETLIQRFDAMQQVARQQLIERDQQLPEMLAGLVMMACEQVLRYELSEGAKNIHGYVRSALQQLPDGEEAKAKIFISQDDASWLEGQLAEYGETLEFNIDKQLAAGECVVKTPDSRVDYRAFEHLQQLLEQLAPALIQSAPAEEVVGAALDEEIEQAMLNPEPANEAVDSENPADDFVADDGVDELEAAADVAEASQPAEPEMSRQESVDSDSLESTSFDQQVPEQETSEQETRESEAPSPSPSAELKEGANIPSVDDQAVSVGDSATEQEPQAQSETQPDIGAEPQTESDAADPAEDNDDEIV